MADVDIDLYADVEEFPLDENDKPEEPASSNNDLYDDVLSSKQPEEKEDVKEESETNVAGTSTGTTPLPTRRYQLYVGNLTWWTTDQDIQDAVQDLGTSLSTTTTKSQISSGFTFRHHRLYRGQVLREQDERTKQRLLLRLGWVRGFQPDHHGEAAQERDP